MPQPMSRAWRRDVVELRCIRTQNIDKTLPQLGPTEPEIAAQTYITHVVAATLSFGETPVHGINGAGCHNCAQQ